LSPISGPLNIFWPLLVKIWPIIAMRAQQKSGILSLIAFSCVFALLYGLRAG
jgi:hypothetical protein